ncbi:uvrD/REP helicase N-terminal domain protein [Acinetobacter sp. 1542444]|uniref:UvrD-helicase domain-containing protein n=1 Tax=Acinetobacter sp. 1542444 TaxID=1310681 RepID=UPI00044937EA|nr:UvrD-helicase domain-containing protein [Acinetobacter sp. 1542444]EXE61926.1 uvrD/REP helicase N-terminal domain protein [Acinetobacter sp. 1542444]
MDLKPSLLSYIFTGSTNWKLSYTFPKLKLDFNKQTNHLTLDKILDINIQSGWIWSSVTLSTSEQNYVLKGIFNSQAKVLKSNLLNDIEFLNNKKNADTIKEVLKPYLQEYQNFIQQNIYLSHRLCSLFRADLSERAKNFVEKFSNLIERDSSFAFEADLQNLFEQLRQFIELPIKANYAIDAKNKCFVESELKVFKSFFDQVESTPLTNEQRISSIIFEDRNLLVAAAGSGKTSTIVGKVGYALLTGLYKPEEILVLAFNKNAGEELNERINLRLKDILTQFNTGVEALNFHKFGVKVIGRATGKSPSVSEDAVRIQPLLNRIIQNLTETDLEFQEKYLLFKTAYLRPPLSPFAFKTINDWEKAQKRSFDRFKDGFETYQGEIVKSHGEKAIANWLYSQGVPYQYEKKYEHDTANENHRQYKPDFYLPEINLYLEHYAIDQHGKPPAHFGQKYLDDMKWKSGIHKQYKTDLITTTFHQFITGSIFEKLEQELKSRGQEFRPRSLAEINSKAQSIFEYGTNELYGSFLNHFKSNQVNMADLLARPLLSLRERLFLELFSKVYQQYDQLLKTSKEYDFDDLLIESAQLINENKYKSPFKLIIVDEFQDTSQARARLILSLLNQVPEAKLFCVGDDWQAIYRFAGSDISIFTQFEKVFGYTKQTQLTQTFRSNQGIANVASGFIQKNKSQLQKVVNAIDKTSNKVVEISFLTKTHEIHEYLFKTLTEINNANTNSEGKKSIYILGRYNHNKPNLDNLLPFLKNCRIEFKTIHSSKGLQADYVILVGLNSGSSAFPSEKEDDPLLNIVLPQPETHAFAEERRLFYVALTRAKEKVFLIGELNSVFLEEITKEQNFKEFIYIPQDELKSINRNIPPEWLCPQCEEGRLRKKTGKFGNFLGCDRYPTCDYTKSLKQR